VSGGARTAAQKLPADRIDALEEARYERKVVPWTDPSIRVRTEDHLSRKARRVIASGVPKSTVENYSGAGTHK
jgi:hypothetical protein